MVNGIDVSDFQAGIDMGQVHAAGFSWVMIKATQGTTFVAQSFQPLWQAAGNAGLLRGGYHYYIFNDDPKQQAQFFLKHCPPQKGALPPAIDVEVGQQGNVPPAAQNVQNLGTFLQTVEAATGVRCILYMGFDGWSQLLGSTAGFSGHPLWVPSYIKGVTAPPPPQNTPPIMQPPPPQITAWKTWTMWQYSETGSAAGKNVDLDVFNGSLAQLQALCQK